jgi:(p)ppGpp synthase/HD superfamily hydrolase
MRDEDQALLVDALRFALEAHGRQTRKGIEVPYASHLLEVAGLVLRHGGDAQQTAAALLHDVLEDCAGVDAAALRSHFGADVARIVECCSDLLAGDSPDAKSDWLSRKRRYIAHLRRSDARTRLVAACDKLQNLRDLIADLECDGIATLARFNASPTQTRWYYEEVFGALGTDLPRRLRIELGDWIERLADCVASAAPEG